MHHSLSLLEHYSPKLWIDRSDIYLLPYWPDDKLPGGFVRFSFFFPFPEDFALLTGLISLLALDLKERFWRWPLFIVGFFLMFLSGTRSVWLILPVVLLLRYLIVAGQRWGTSLLLGLVGLTCFISLSFTPVTDYLTDTYNLVSESTGNMRKDSTEVRSLIYQRTWEAIVEEPSDFVVGRGIPGPTVLPGYEPAKVGSHSFILGTLLYRTGIIGTVSFLGYWVTYILKLYQTRDTRPICALLMLLYLSVALLSMDVSMINYILILVVMLDDTKVPLNYQFGAKHYGKT
jgi:O-antigen ligase